MRRKPVVAVLLLSLCVAVALTARHARAQSRAADERYAELVGLRLAEFALVNGKVTDAVARVVANPGILDVDNGFRDELAERAHQARAILGEIRDLRPGGQTRDAHRLLDCAATQYETYYAALLKAMDAWTDETPSLLLNLSRDASVTFNTYLARVPR
ncbi:MAG: hypothetical protein PHH57_06735 [Candidatus Omnitrophica bacterium]|jgi:hypothetical protein|nr:hypothetical protein [Candidatus Omnitrophota bacterium]